METRQTGKRTSDSTTTTVEDLIRALSDKRVMDLLANIFEKQLNPILQSVKEVIEKNQKLEDDVCKLRGELEAANEKNKRSGELCSY